MTPVPIDYVWPFIEKAFNETPREDGTTAETVKQACRDKRALCLESSDGVVIVSLVPNFNFGDNELSVLFACAWEGAPHGAFERQQEALAQVARDLTAKRLVFHTTRRGWERRIGPEWKLRYVAYERAV